MEPLTCAELGGLASELGDVRMGEPSAVAPVNVATTGKCRRMEESSSDSSALFSSMICSVTFSVSTDWILSEDCGNKGDRHSLHWLEMRHSQSSSISANYVAGRLKSG